MDPIKEAFQRAKQDIQELKEQINSLSKEIESLKSTLIPTNQQTNKPTNTQIIQQTSNNQQTNQQNTPTHNLNEPYKLPLEALKDPNLKISTGNEGVPTDRQTNQQTDRQTTNIEIYEEKENLREVSKLLESLDSLKKELRFKFKKLTNQEMAVFAAIYQLEEQGFSVDYPLLSQKFKLSESSIRDYTLRIIKKGIPINKTKENNKKVLLSISKDLKKIASLSTILQLREI